MAEIAIERSVIRPYPDVAQALQACQGSGKTIVVTTDTYLPRTFIQEILDGILPCSFTLYCSSERGNTKRHGTAFKDLVTMFPGQRIVHFGDNARSDVTMARGHGITPCLVRWQRPDFLARNARYLRYGASQGALTLDTPYDRPSPDTPSERAQREIAWRWAIVLADFVKQAHRYAQDVGAQEIWLLSRDCESIHDVLASGTAPAGAIPTRYVHTSRAATYPILAHSDETVFARWRNRPATDDDRRAGKDLIAAYQAMVEPAVERILIVDIGWKGRVQIAIQTALPDVEVFGFYMSLSDEAEPATRARSRVFCGWDRTILNQAGAEALSGYRQGSCTGYRATQNGWAPVFKDAEGDVAPAAYCESLRQHLGDFLAQSAGSDDEALRRDALADILTRPDAITARAFETWGIGAEISSDPTGSLVAGGKTDLVSRALGREIRDNVWPELAMWSLSRHPLAVTLLQKQMRARKRLQQK
ncbi:HAD family hydrolase [Novosphingobium sp. NBM11]|nr:HAD family hydrolase [Novosphingobium sp. NBM11]